MVRPVPPGLVAVLVNGGIRRGSAFYASVVAVSGARDNEVLQAGLVHDEGQILAAVPATARPVLGVLPLGTANDFARTLDLPRDLAAAVATLTSGQVARNGSYRW